MHLLIPAAGTGRRMGASRNKLLLKLLHRSLLGWTLANAGASKSIVWIGIIGQPADFSDFTEIVAQLSLDMPFQLIMGGETRQQSVYNGLQALPPEADRVLIHDGARCLATPDLFDRCTEALQSVSGLIAAIPVKDTIKIVDSKNLIQDTPDRDRLWAAQTPQGFEVQLLKECHQKGHSLSWDVTDDAALFERCGLPVQIVEGEETNLKVTTPVDLQIAEFILKERLAKC